MRLFNTMKKAAITTLAVAVLVAGSADVQAKTVDQPQQTKKDVVSLNTDGTDVPLNNVTNLKINGKKYSKGSIKKKVKTVKVGTNARAYQDWKGSYTNILDEEMVYDEVQLAKERQNYKYITTYDYELDFLKTGTYKISFDRYSEGQEEVVKSADGKFETVTPVLEKTHYVYTYKVLASQNAVKSISLGKTTITTKVTKKGSKSTTKTTIKNRYLKGTSGKLVFKMNKNYALTSAYAVTRNAQGYLVVTPVANKSTVNYSAVSLAGVYTWDKVVADAQGKDTYVEDPATKSKSKARATVETGKKTDKYKITEIYYGYKDKYMGNYTNYAVEPLTVYIPNRDAKGDVVYKTNDKGYHVDNNGDYVWDSEDYVPVATTPVTATVLKSTTLEYRLFNGTYQPVEVVRQQIISPTAETGLADPGDYWVEGNYDYYVDALGTQGRQFGETTTVSVGGIAPTIVLADGSTRSNVLYSMATDYYANHYEGSWVPYAEGLKDVVSWAYEYDAQGKLVKEWVYVIKKDADDDWISKEHNTDVDFDSTTGYQPFYAK